MDLLILFIDNQLKKLIINGVKLNIMGDLSQIPKKPRKSVENAIEKTKSNKKMVLNNLAKYKFNFTPDYLKGMNAGEMAKFIQEKISHHITNDEAVKMAKKFLKTDLVKKYSEGLISREQIKIK